MTKKIQLIKTSKTQKQIDHVVSDKSSEIKSKDSLENKSSVNVSSSIRTQSNQLSFPFMFLL